MVTDANTVMNLAIQQFNCKHYARGVKISLNDDKAFLHRLCVNYIRHMLTDYDNLPHSAETKQNILHNIAKTYPVFSRECERQQCKL